MTPLDPNNHISQMISRWDVEAEGLQATIAALRADLARAQAIIDDLEKLTPGGSEFSNYPERCILWVKQQMALMGKIAAERNAAQARIGELEAALKVYANEATWIPPLYAVWNKPSKGYEIAQRALERP